MNIMQNFKDWSNKHVILFLTGVIALVIFLGLGFAIFATPLIPDETYIIAGAFYSMLCGLGIYFVGTKLK
jgi:hypothetical protein